MKTLDQFISDYNGKTICYPNGQYCGQCLSLVKVYMKEMFGFNPPPSGSNSAYGYWSNFPNPLGDYFTKILNTPQAVPQEGDIIIWDTNAGNGYGHIAIFLEGNVGSFRSLDQNWNGKETHIQGHYYTNVKGWLRPKSSTMPDNQAELDKMREERDTNWNLYQAEKKKYEGLQEEVARLKADNSESYAQAELRKKELQKFIEDLAKKLFLPSASDQTDILGSVERLLEVEDQLKEANKIISKKDAEFLKKENEWEAEIDELKGIISKLNLRIEKLESDMEAGKESKADFNWFSELVQSINDLLKGKR